MNIIYCNDKPFIKAEPSDTIETIASHTHFTADELCDILNGIISDKVEANKDSERDRMTREETIARRICCPMCDRKKCDREADDCDVKIYLKNKPATKMFGNPR